MKLTIIVAVLVILFVAVTASDLIFNGVFETPSIHVAHFDAGAGTYLLLFRGLLAVLTTMLLIAWAFIPRQSSTSRLAKVAAALLPCWLFWLSATAIERYSVGFDDLAFSGLLQRWHSGSTLDTADIFSALGEPLAREAAKSTEGIAESWLYTYMPSSGFGWRKRVIFFDASGTVHRILSIDEP